MPHTSARLPERLFALLQFCLPTRLLSRAMHALAECRIHWVKQSLINNFCRLYKIDLSEAAEPQPTAYPSFNAFFTRALQPGARIMTGGDATVVAPVDGALGAFGRIEGGRLFQTKGMAYNLNELLAGHDDCCARFVGGSYATLYLAPRDYHRVHMPLAGRLQASHYIPGRLFGVNPASVRAIPRLFSRNERLLARFDTAFGPMAVIMVGAFCVGGLETRWAGSVCPPHQRQPRPLQATTAAAAGAFQRGEEMGRFNLGSSVILLFGPNMLTWNPALAAGQTLRLGQTLARAG
ncbi:MAG TPA: archaetidylserine decarboxylase [Salinisphaeraceae bacterium]|nr:archaetidylserine decarboxylase [Salinisphaeraceae bacterium]